MNIVERIIEVLVGLVLLVLGSLIIYVIHTLVWPSWPNQGDVWDLGFLLIVEACSIVGSLIILLGLRHTLGRRKFVERWISRSLQHFALVVLLLSFGILAAIIFVSR